MRDERLTENEIEERLRRVVPRGAPAALRNEVLTKVAAELDNGRSIAWQRWAGVAAAAMLAFAFALNGWIVTSVDQQTARIYGPRPTPRPIADVADAVTAVAGAETGQSIQQQLLAVRPKAPSPERYAQSVRQLIIELQLTNKGYSRGEIQEDTEVERDRDHGADRGATYRQRHAELECQFTA